MLPECLWSISDFFLSHYNQYNFRKKISCGIVHSRHIDLFNKYLLNICYISGIVLKVVNSTVKKTDAIPVVIVNSLVMRPINNCTTMGNAYTK